jgi:hypothetical protein
MAQHHRGYVFGGLLAVGAAFLLGGWAERPTAAQPPAAAPPPAAGRYQITASFVLQNLTPGAYVLDTQTGDVFQVVGKGAPEFLGTAARPKPKE